jgi:RNA binding exosome subunit
MELSADDMVYYLHTDKQGVAIKFAAVVLSIEDDGINIRVARYDVHSKEVSTFESIVSSKSLQIRSIPCSYEDELIRSTD